MAGGIEFVSVIATEAQAEDDIDCFFNDIVEQEISLGPNRFIAVQARLSKSLRKVLKGEGKKLPVEMQMESVSNGVFYSQKMRVKGKAEFAFWESPPTPPSDDGEDVTVSIHYFHPTSGERESISHKVRVFPPNRGVVRSDLPFPPASEAQIAAAEKRWKITLCDDYKAFLLKQNGLRLDWWWHGRWRTKMDGFYDALAEGEESVERHEHHELMQLYRLGSGHHCLDCDGDEFPFYSPKLIRWGVAIGEDPAGNLFIQIIDGKRRGQIVMLDHEMYHGGMSVLADWENASEEDRARFNFDNPEAAGADKVWNALIKADFTPFVAPDLETFLTPNIAHATDTMAAMDKKYLNNSDERLNARSGFLSGAWGLIKSMFASSPRIDPKDWTDHERYVICDITHGFPPSVPVPPFLSRFIDWLADKPCGAVGTFEVYSTDIADLLPDGQELKNEFAPFLSMPDGSLVALWLRNDRNSETAPVVFLDSEGQGFTLAQNLEVFVGRLATGAFTDDDHEEDFLPYTEDPDGGGSGIPNLQKHLCDWFSKSEVKIENLDALNAGIDDGFDDGEFANWVKNWIETH